MADLISAGNINFILVFIEGILSFFSPCVIPLIPVYISFLAGNAKKLSADGSISYDRKKVFLHTVFFVLGISSAFFILGISFTALGGFFQTNRSLFTRIGGIIILFLGLVQVGFIEFKFLQRERKLPFNPGTRGMNPLIAFVMGFTFSFAWTPCVGPALSSVLILASSSNSSIVGNLLVLVYSLGFIIPFLLLGIFTTQALMFLKKRKRLIKYTVKAGGVILIAIGIMTFTGWMNGVSSYFNQFVPPTVPGSGKDMNDEITASPEATKVPETALTPEATYSPEATSTPDSGTSSGEPSAQKATPAFDFTLTDQNGAEHTLSDYKGKVVFLNFWATWCPPCQKEMPDIEQLYLDNGKNEGDVIVLGVANPSTEEYPNNSDEAPEKIIEFLNDNGYTFPVVFDETGDVLADYRISAFPTTFIINPDGTIYGYAAGMLTREIMDNAIKSALEQAENEK